MPRILVVEDDEMIGALLVALLEDMDFEVCPIASTESAAIEAALRLRPDLMIVDARLGRGSGIAAMEEIERHHAVPHIFMSGERLPQPRQDAPVLMKPFTRHQLSGAIQVALQVPVA